MTAVHVVVQILGTGKFITCTSAWDDCCTCGCTDISWWWVCVHWTETNSWHVVLHADIIAALHQPNYSGYRPPVSCTRMYHLLPRLGWNCPYLLDFLSISTAVFPGGPWLASARMSPFWILQQLRMVVVVTTRAIRRAKAPVKSLPPTNQHPVFLQARCPSCRQTNSVRALNEKLIRLY